MLLQLVPGDPVITMLGGQGTPEQITALRQELWLDRPVVVQYWHWLSSAVQGNLGRFHPVQRPRNFGNFLTFAVYPLSFSNSPYY